MIGVVRKGWALSMLAMLVALMGCDLMSTRVADGGGSEATNGNLAGTAVHADGAVAAWSSVILRPVNHLRDTSKVEREVIPDALADGNGRFSIAAIPPGAYTMEIRDGKGLASVRSVFAVAGKSEVLSPDTLRPTGTVNGMLGSIPGFAVPGYVRVYGLELLVRADSTGRFTLGSLPLGRHRIQAVAAQAGWSYPDQTVDLHSSRDTVDLGILPLQNFMDEDYLKWAGSRKLRIDAEGIADTLPDFTVLIRLDSGNFDFASADGGDLRFSDAAGRHLAYEVESYSRTRRRAAIWVRLDTLYGGTGDRFINMHWGKAGAPDFSEGKRAFPHADGLWHLDAESLAGAGGGGSERHFPDASPAGNHGKGDAHPVETSAQGPGISVTGGQQVVFADPSAFSPARQFAFSAWFRAGESDTAGGEIGSMADNYGLRLREDGSLYFFMVDDGQWQPGQPVTAGSWKQCSVLDTNLIDDRWHHAAAVFDGAFMRVYLDGTEAARVPHAGKTVYPFKGGFRIGRHGFGTHDKDFRGSLDEFRYSRTAWSAGRIKADFENQKPDSRLIRFE